MTVFASLAFGHRLVGQFILIDLLQEICMALLAELASLCAHEKPRCSAMGIMASVATVLSWFVDRHRSLHLRLEIDMTGQAQFHRRVSQQLLVIGLMRGVTRHALALRHGAMQEGQVFAHIRVASIASLRSRTPYQEVAIV